MRGAAGPYYPVWQAPLYSVTWDGGAVNATTVRGDVTITPIRPATEMTPVTATEFIYSWHLDGKAGSEHFTRSGTTMPASTSTAARAPQRAVVRADAIRIRHGRTRVAELQNDTFYFYDSLGMPRWAAGSANPFAASTTLDMYQLSGFCPTCTAVPTTVVGKIGTLGVDYTNATTGHYTAHLDLLPPLSGAWKIAQPTSRITGTSACTQY